MFWQWYIKSMLLNLWLRLSLKANANFSKIMGWIEAVNIAMDIVSVEPVDIIIPN